MYSTPIKGENSGVKNTPQGCVCFILLFSLWNTVSSYSYADNIQIKRRAMHCWHYQIFVCLCKVSVHVHPAFTPPYLFPIGEAAITYTATDSSSNQASCTFYIKVIGKSSPNCGGRVTKTIPLYIWVSSAQVLHPEIETTFNQYFKTWLPILP